MFFSLHTLRTVLIPLTSTAAIHFCANQNSFSDSSQIVHIDRYQGQTVIIRDKAAFLKKKAKFINDGPNKLQICSDFDHTISKYNVGGGVGRSSHGVIESAMSNDLREKTDALFRYYYPLEVSTSLDDITKAELMKEWTIKCHDVITESSLTRKDLLESVKDNLENNKVALRDNSEAFFKLSKQYEIPVLVFSGGIGDVVEEILRQGLKYINDSHRTSNSSPSSSEDPSRIYSLPNNIHVVSNRMIFSGNDPSDKVIGFDELVFHVFNKRASSIGHTSFLQLEDLHLRENLLLIGDSLGDPHMSDGLPCDADSTIKIAFLNAHLDRLPAYLTEFDMVILGDPGFEIPLSIIRDIVEGSGALDFFAVQRYICVGIEKDE